MTFQTNDKIEGYGDDAQKWAKGFNETAVKLGYSEMDEGWLIGWFANAIERSHTLRMNRLREKIEPIVMEELVVGADMLSRGFAKMQDVLQWT